MTRVLIVDDEPMILEVAQMSLELAGWQVTTANGGEEGLAKAAAEQPDAVLMDVMMPGMDGPTTCLRMAADPRTSGIPVVLLTAKVQPADRQEWADLPIKGVLRKPFDPFALAQDVARLLGWS